MLMLILYHAVNAVILSENILSYKEVMEYDFLDPTSVFQNSNEISI